MLKLSPDTQTPEPLYECAGCVGYHGAKELYWWGGGVRHLTPEGFHARSPVARPDWYCKAAIERIVGGSSVSLMTYELSVERDIGPSLAKFRNAVRLYKHARISSRCLEI